MIRAMPFRVSKRLILILMHYVICVWWSEKRHGVRKAASSFPSRKRTLDRNIFPDQIWPVGGAIVQIADLRFGVCRDGPARIISELSKRKRLHPLEPIFYREFQRFLQFIFSSGSTRMLIIDRNYDCDRVFSIGLENRLLESFSAEKCLSTPESF